jgi:hypothetical protein
MIREITTVKSAVLATVHCHMPAAVTFEWEE